eukprot:TRINITY_DN5919_c0_g1_i2.p1 TRINITY_DN5919_c0_g1~~TRINITY_DN5919_c0_g1_i2.p1  ORF type:complete len:607 (+),score=171.35 TRINITY_DN5919_c0_g1_i2:40-1860(+)
MDIFENITNEYQDGGVTERKMKKRKKFDNEDDDDDDSFKGGEDEDEEDTDYTAYMRKRSKGSRRMREDEGVSTITGTSTFIPPTTIFKTPKNDTNEEKEYQFAAPIPSIFTFGSSKKENKMDFQVLPSNIKDQFFTPILNTNLTSESQLFSLISYGKMKKEKGIYKYNDRSRDFLLDTTNLVLQGRRTLLINIRSGLEEHITWALSVLLHQSIYGPYISLSAPLTITCDEYNNNFVVSVSIFNALLDLVQYKIDPIESFKRNSERNLNKTSSINRLKESNNIEMVDEDKIDKSPNKQPNKFQTEIFKTVFSPKLLSLAYTKFLHVFSLLNNFSNTDEPTSQYMASEKRIFEMSAHLFSVLRIKVPISSHSFRSNKTFPDNILRSNSDLCARDETWNEFVAGIDQLNISDLKKVSILVLDMIDNISKHVQTPQFDVKNFLRSLLYFFYLENESIVDQAFRIFINLTKIPEVLSQIPLILSGDNQSDPTFYNRLLSLVVNDGNHSYNEIIFDLFYNLSKIGKIFSDSFSLSDGISTFINFILHSSIHDHDSKNVNLCRRIILTVQNLASSSMLNKEKLKSTKESLLFIVSKEYPISAEVLDILLTFCE